MALVATSSRELAAMFDSPIQNKIIEVYTAIPGSLVKFLEERKIVKRINFSKDFSANQVAMGTKASANFVDFEMAFRRTIKAGFDSNGVTEVRAEDISRDLAVKYREKAPTRPGQGGSASTIVTFNTTYQKKEGAFWTSVNAYVHLFVKEECEDNWFATDKRKFSYELTVEVHGFSLDKTKSLKFAQVVSDNTTADAIQNIRSLAPLTFGDLWKNRDDHMHSFGHFPRQTRCFLFFLCRMRSDSNKPSCDCCFLEKKNRSRSIAKRKRYIKNESKQKVQNWIFKTCRSISKRELNSLQTSS